MTPEDQDVEEALDDVWHYVALTGGFPLAYPIQSLCGKYTYLSKEHHAKIIGNGNACFECSLTLRGY